jgi:aminocarboxymuconate-semialdehyde decarboxylase
VEIIDVHAHFVSGGLAERLDGRSRPCPNVGARRLADGRISFTFPGLPPTRPMPDALTDTQRAMGWLDQAGIDRHIVSIWSDLFGYSLSPEEGAAWSRLVNEETMRAISGLDRIAVLATVPIQSGRHAVQELQAAKELGCCGVTVGTGAPGRELDDKDLEVFWEAAGALRMPVFIHPLYLYGERRLESYGLANAVGRLNDTTVAVSRLLFAGVPVRHPDLAVIVAHGGGGVPYALGRLKRNHALAAKDLADPVAGFQRLHFDTVVFEPAALRYLLTVAGADHIMLGSDYPFPIQDPQPLRIVREAAPDDAAAEAILGGNARRVFAL